MKFMHQSQNSMQVKYFHITEIPRKQTLFTESFPFSRLKTDVKPEMIQTKDAMDKNYHITSLNVQ